MTRRKFLLTIIILLLFLIAKFSPGLVSAVPSGTGVLSPSIVLTGDTGQSETMVTGTGSLRITNIAIYPNPFTPLREQIRISYNLTENATVEVKIYDWGGTLVYAYPSVTGISGAPNYFTWDGRNSQGRMVANGIYFCKIVARTKISQTSEVIKLVVTS